MAFCYLPGTSKFLQPKDEVEMTRNCPGKYSQIQTSEQMKTNLRGQSI